VRASQTMVSPHAAVITHATVITGVEPAGPAVAEVVEATEVASQTAPSRAVQIAGPAGFPAAPAIQALFGITIGVRSPASAG
jgi:hypothetical protein